MDRSPALVRIVHKKFLTLKQFPITTLAKRYIHRLFFCFSFCLVTTQASAILVIETPNQILGDLPTDTSGFPFSVWGDGIMHPVIGDNFIHGGFSCLTFSCHDPGDSFFIIIPVGLEISHIYTYADTEQLIIRDASSQAILLNEFIHPFGANFTDIYGAGLYDFQFLNGIQNVNGTFTGVGGAPGGWNIRLTLQAVTNQVLVPVPGSLLLLGLGLLSFGLFRKRSVF